jgi:hypothetical protein
MSYRVHWRLLGRGNRLLDSGELDGGFADRQAALLAIGAFLQQFAQCSRGQDGSWWARRSPDADLWVQVCLIEQAAPEPAIVPPVWIMEPGKDAAPKP